MRDLNQELHKAVINRMERIQRDAKFLSEVLSNCVPTPGWRQDYEDAKSILARMSKKSRVVRLIKKGDPDTVTFFIRQQ